jgi:hypothetical protein
LNLRISRLFLIQASLLLVLAIDKSGQTINAAAPTHRQRPPPFSPSNLPPSHSSLTPSARPLKKSHTSTSVIPLTWSILPTSDLLLHLPVTHLAHCTFSASRLSDPRPLGLEPSNSTRTSYSIHQKSISKRGAAFSRVTHQRRNPAANKLGRGPLIAAPTRFWLRSIALQKPGPFSCSCFSAAPPR